MKQIEIVRELKKRLRRDFGDIFDRIVFYGSQAAGRGVPGSDFDILVVVNGKVDWKLENSILKTCYGLDLEYGILTDIKVISRTDLSSIRGKQPSVAGAMERGVLV
jgi:predicted nucleotidyltransferase